MKISKFLTSLEKIVGNFKFAITLILIFIVFLIAGTLIESLYGREFAGKLIYKSSFFFILQFLFFLSIFVATLVRLPPVKRLYGFYTLHSGLLLLLAGPFVTYFSGVDGMIALSPNTPTNVLELSEYLLEITNEQKQRFLFPLPSTVFEGKPSFNFSEHPELNALTPLTYLPFAEKKLRWQKEKNSSSALSSSLKLFSGEFLLKNPQAQQKFIVSNHPKAQEFLRPQSLGPLTLEYWGEGLHSCLQKHTQFPQEFLFIVNESTQECFRLNELETKQALTQKKTPFVVLKNQQKIYVFFPDQSPLAYNEDLTPAPESPFKILNFQEIAKSPMVLLFQEEAAFFDKKESSWKFSKYTLQQSILLPWMGLELIPLRLEKELYPKKEPSYLLPRYENGQQVTGNLKAIKFQHNKEEFWVTSEDEQWISLGEKPLKLTITPRVLLLPFALTLDEFILKKNPGTNTPASFESFVLLQDKKGKEEKAHIYMNNPLKKDGLTFYQSSYFQQQEGTYGSVLSVNRDPGRWIKYLGSILLVFGSALHFWINRKTKTFFKRHSS